MKKVILPAVVCAAAGALVLILALQRDGGRRERSGEARNERDRPAAPAVPAARPPIVDKSRPPTPTPVEKNAALSDLELFVGRRDIPRARYAQALVCEKLPDVLADPALLRNLLDLIRKEGIESDDLEMRDVLLPILRVLPVPEATQMIEREYYRAKNEAERSVLLEAMAHTYHNPERAGTIATYVALNSDSEEERFHAFDVVRNLAEDDLIIFRMASQVCESTTREEQRQLAYATISDFAYRSHNAQKWLRSRLQAAKIEEVYSIVERIEAWGDEADAAHLEAIADDYPAAGPVLRAKAEQVRQTVKQRRIVNEPERRLPAKNN